MFESASEVLVDLVLLDELSLGEWLSLLQLSHLLDRNLWVYVQLGQSHAGDLGKDLGVLQVGTKRPVLESVHAWHALAPQLVREITVLLPLGS